MPKLTNAEIDKFLWLAASYKFNPLEKDLKKRNYIPSVEKFFIDKFPEELHKVWQEMKPELIKKYSIYHFKTEGEKKREVLKFITGDLLKFMAEKNKEMNLGF